MAIYNTYSETRQLVKKGLEIIQQEGIKSFIITFLNIAEGKLKNMYRVYKFQVNGKEQTNIDTFEESIRVSTKNYEQYARASEYKISSASTEKEVAHLLLEKIDEGDVFYDIGSNIGIYSCIVGKASNAKIFAFEPHPKNVKEIKLNKDLNGININIHSVALSDNSGTAELQVLKTNEAGGQEHTLSEVEYHQSSHSEMKAIRVDKVAGDELIHNEELPLPNVLKIDVEGAGPNVIRGLSESLSTTEPHTLVIEPHNNISEIQEELRTLGFKIKIMREYIYAYKSD